MYSKYRCSICNTSPDQISHHKAHLKTQKHAHNRKNYIKNMRLFSHQFRQIHPRKWEESSEREYILEQYIKSNTKQEPPNFLNVSQWIVNQGFDEKYDYDGWSDKSDKLFEGCSSEEYYKNTGIRIEPCINFEDITQLNEYITYSNWAINKIADYKETIDTKDDNENICNLKSSELDDPSIRDNFSLRRNRINNSNMLSKYTDVKLGTLNIVRKGKVNLNYLFSLISIDTLANNEINFELYNDRVAKNASLLFRDMGIWKMAEVYMNHVRYNCKCNECYDTEFYFHKKVLVKCVNIIEDVDNSETINSEYKNVWVSCSMYKIYDDNCSQSHRFKYLSDNEFKNVIKLRLINMYQENIDNLQQSIIQQKINSCVTEDTTINHRSEINQLLQDLNYLMQEKITIENNLSSNSKLLNDIVKICEYLFKYDEKLIEHYKNLDSSIVLDRPEPEF